MRLRPWLLLYVVLSLAWVSTEPLRGQSPDRRPNIVFIFMDDLAYQAISAYGDSRHLLETPHIDRLAREGMRFDRALVPNSICGPSRATVLTGKYSHVNGFPNNNNCVFDGSQTTFPKLLHQSGYQTSIFGKWHLESNPTGFDHWEILPGQGVYYQPTFIRHGVKVQEEGYVTDLITEKSMTWLDKRDPNRPFLLMMQHKAPHRSWEPALRHLNHDQDRDYPEHPTLFEDLSQRNLAVRDHFMGLSNAYMDFDAKLTPYQRLTTEQRKEWDAYYQPRNEAFLKASLQGKDLTRWRYNRYLHDYLGTVKSVDESVGVLLKYLDDHGLTENTMVVLSSDQGFYMGEHGWFDKRWIFEESLRTPLIVRWPRITPAGSTNDDLVSTVDFAQTFLEIAGVEEPKEENGIQMQGRSLMSILKGETPRDWRKSFYYHYYEYPFHHRVRPHYGVVTSQYKLIHFYAPDLDEWELYDIKKDPLETKNFYHDPEYRDIREQLHLEVNRLREELKVPEKDPDGFWGNGPTLKQEKRVPLNEVVFEIKEDQISTFQHEGISLVELEGHQTLKFSGKQSVEVKNSERLNPAGIPWSIRTYLHATQPDEVVLARGGQSYGYVLSLDVEGKPVFSMRFGEEDLQEVVGSKSVLNQWVQIDAILDAEQTLSLWVNGKLQAQKKAGQWLARNPNDTMQIGDDHGSQVLKPKKKPYSGAMRKLEIYSGDRRPQ